MAGTQVLAINAMQWVSVLERNAELDGLESNMFFMWTENGIAQTLSAAMGIRENTIQKSAEKRLFGLSGVVGWDGVDVVSVAQPQESVKHTCCVELRPDNNENAEHCICICEK